MRSLIKRYRELIFVTVLLVTPFAVFFARSRRPTSLNLFDRAVVAVTAPVERLITFTAWGASDLFQGYIWLHGVRDENLRLHRQLVREHEQAQRSLELYAENARLRALLDFADKERGTRFVVAAVVAVGASPHSHTLRIARGSDDGVMRGAPVISPEGVVGTVAQTSGGYSDVQLITSPLSALAALSQRTRSRSTIKGVGDVSRCRLEYALRTDDLQDGDVLLTAGGSGLFPKGLRIGRTANVQRGKTGMFLVADVLPAVDFARLDEVMVVTTDAPLGAPASLEALPAPAPAPAPGSSPSVPAASLGGTPP